MDNDEIKISGTIAHVLRTAFRDIFNEEKIRNEAKLAREAFKLQLFEEERIKLAAINEKGKKKPAAKEKAKEKEKPAKEGGKKEAGDVKVVSVDSPEQINLDASSNTKLEEFYVSPFEKLQLSDALQSKYESRLQELIQDIESKKASTSFLREYLSTEQQTAAKLQRAEEDMLKTQGIIVQVHIPALPTKLCLKGEVLTSCGSNFAFINPQTIMETIRTESLRRAGQLSISSEAEEYLQARSKLKVVSDSDTPHYLLGTEVCVVRDKITEARLNLNGKKKPLLRSSSRLPTLMFASKQAGPHISMVQELLDENVRRSMTQKLSFQRNPRSTKESLSRSLTKAPALGSSQIGESEVFFIAEPPLVEFEGFSCGEELLITLQLRNVSTLLRSLRCIPPRTVHFSMSPLSYPATSLAGLLAPGMSATTVISFRPDSLRDFTDSISIETENGNFIVPIQATRCAPVLSIPSALRIGTCLVGDAIRVEFPCFNSGGNGRFQLVPTHTTSHNSFDEASFQRKCQSSLKLKAFTVYPAAFEVKKNESFTLFVDFVPLAVGHHYDTFQVLAENLLVRDYQVSGDCRCIDLSLSSIDQINLSKEDVGLYTGLHFTDEDSHCFGVRNESGIPLEFEWIFLSDDEKNVSDIIPVCLRKLVRSERQYERYVFSRDHSRLDAKNGISKSDDDFEAMFEREASQENNFLQESGFQLCPKRGIFPVNAEIQFETDFMATRSKECATVRNISAVLILKHVPLAATPEGLSEREILADKGHIPFYKVLSWAESLSKVRKVDSSDPTGLSSSFCSLFSLHTQLSNHFNKSAKYQFMETFLSNVMELKRCFERCSDEETLGSDDDSDSKKVANSGNPFSMRMLYWDGEPESEHKQFFVPAFTTRSPRKITNIDLGKHAHVLSLLWVDSASIPNLFGPDLSAAIQEDVIHEAVDFLQRSCQRSVVALSIAMHYNAL